MTAKYDKGILTIILQILGSTKQNAELISSRARLIRFFRLIANGLNARFLLCVLALGKKGLKNASYVGNGAPGAIICYDK